ncbi:nuclease [Nocardia sp. XZ_19_385]|uniref:nuclease n=1 Tax=Nocardia sp. XZ_19_385 TaxID=2769488 RepID=UPI00188FC526|nr:nuclease [Nocardia sp. XZ_19_385]
MVELGFVGVSRPANDHRFVSTTDGDTPNIEMAVRMVSIDTPESQFGGSPPTAQAALERAKTRLTDGTFDALPKELRDYLVARITPDAAQRHLAAGKAAAEVHKQMVDTRLTRPDGSRRKMAVIATGELIESKGRMLAYTAPWFSGSASDPMPPRDDPRRRTFNLELVAAGWAATFIIYPSIPRTSDLNMLLDAAKLAWDNKSGAWTHGGADLLLAYEYRALIKLGAANLENAAATMDEAFQRVCVDLRDLTEVGLHGYHEVPPPDRLWFWAKDIEQARRDLPITH